MEPIDVKEIEEIETGNITKNPDWFYHGFDFGDFTDIMEKGILAKKYLDYPVRNFGLNGKHYISIAKDIKQPGAALTRYKHMGPLLILEETLEAIKCEHKKIYYPFRFTRFPIRYTCWPDEYQVYSKILPDKFIGIECMIHEWAEAKNIFLLRRLRTLIELMKSFDTELPIYDFSRETGNLVHELDKDAYLEVSKRLINKNPWDK